jgi:hypothetical protein
MKIFSPTNQSTIEVQKREWNETIIIDVKPWDRQRIVEALIEHFDLYLAPN